MGFIWITEVGGAVGPALARRLNSSGIPLVLTARDQKRLEQLVGTLQSPSVFVCPADVTDRSSAQLAIEASVTRFSTPADLAHCVGLIITKPPHLTSEGDLRRTLDANLFLAWNALHLFVQQAIHHKVHVSTVLIGSVATTTGFPDHGVVASAEIAVAVLAQSAAATYVDHNIRVDYIHLELTLSTMSSRPTSAPAVVERLAKANPLSRLGQGGDTVALAEFLLNPAASQITGQQIGVGGDHGRLAVLPKPRVRIR